MAVQVIIARMLGPDGVGRIAYIVWLVEIANLLSCFGLPNSLTRYLAELHGQKKEEDATRFAQWIFVRYVLLTLIGSVLVGVLFFHSSQYEHLQSALPVLMVLFLARGLQTINRAHLAGRQRFDVLARINVAAAVTLVVAVAIGASAYGVTGAIYGYIAGALIPAVCSFAILRGFSFQQQLDAALRRRVWRFTFHTWLAMVVSAVIWSRVEIFFLERYWDAHQVAMFTVGLTFAMMIRQVTQLFGGTFMAHFSHLEGNDNQSLIQRQYETATRLLAFVVIPMAFGGAAIMPVLIPLVFGGEFAPAIPNAMVLTATSALAFSQIGSALVYARERSDFIALGGLLGAVMSVSAGFLVIPHFGSWGAVWSRLFVQSSMIALGTWFIVTRLHFAYPFGSVGRTGVAGGFCALAAWGIVYFVPHPIAGFSLAVPLGAVVYLFSVKFLRVLGPEEVRQLKRATNRLPARIDKPFGLMLDAIGTAQ